MDARGVNAGCQHAGQLHLGALPQRLQVRGGPLPKPRPRGIPDRHPDGRRAVFHEEIGTLGGIFPLRHQPFPEHRNHSPDPDFAGGDQIFSGQHMKLRQGIRRSFFSRRSGAEKQGQRINDPRPERLREPATTPGRWTERRGHRVRRFLGGAHRRYSAAWT
jgi:hypothetical protein